MNVELFVQNIKYFCKKKGEPTTTVCKNAGVGASFVSDLNRGQTPSVAKVQMLADYLGITTSELLGEKEKPATVSGDGQDPNSVRIAGRDGSLFSKRLTDEQLAALKSIIEQMPEADADYL